MILLDTHVLIWLLIDDISIQKKARQIIERATTEDQVFTSAISYWEIAMLASKNRLNINLNPREIYQIAVSSGIKEIPVTGDIGIQAITLEVPTKDPADRIIVATALHQNLTLVTADKPILGWEGSLKTLAATT